MKFQCNAFDLAGAPVSKVIDASNQSEATNLLHSQGLFVAQINPLNKRDTSVSKKSGKSNLLSRFTGRSKHLVMFTRQMYILISAGTPMSEALLALEKQAHDLEWRATITSLRESIEKGDSLSEAMKHHPQYFDSIYVNMIHAGETSGKFTPMLERLSDLVRKRLQNKKTIIGAILYPSILMFISFAVLIIMFAWVLPRFSMLFENLDMPLPPTTQFMMAISYCLTSYWWLALAIGVGAIIGGILFLRTEAGLYYRDLAIIRLPMIGNISRNFMTARIIRIIGALGDSYVPMLDILDLAKKTAGNIHYQALIGKAILAVENGDPISQAFGDDRFVNPSIYESMRSGEATGKLPEMLLHLADFMDEDNETILRSLTSLLEPVILIVLGLVVGFIAVSMFMPLFDLTSMTGTS